MRKKKKERKKANQLLFISIQTGATKKTNLRSWANQRLPRVRDNLFVGEAESSSNAQERNRATGIYL